MEKLRGTILRLTRFSDTSAIVHWMTPECGLVKTIAKGAFRPKSPFAGRLDLFFSADFVLHRSALPQKEDAPLHHLREIQLVKPRENLRSSYTSILLAGYFCRLLEATLEPEHAEPEISDLLERALDHLATTPPTLRAVLHFEKELARFLGILRPDTPPEDSLREAFPRLPEIRAGLLKRFSGP